MELIDVESHPHLQGVTARLCLQEISKTCPARVRGLPPASWVQRNDWCHHKFQRNDMRRWGSASSAHTDLAHLRTHILLALAPHLRTQI